MPDAQKRALDSLEMELKIVVPSGCWESDIDSPEEQSMLLNPEPSLQPLWFISRCSLILYTKSAVNSYNPLAS